MFAVCVSVGIDHDLIFFLLVNSTGPLVELRDHIARVHDAMALRLPFFYFLFAVIAVIPLSIFRRLDCDTVELCRKIASMLFVGHVILLGCRREIV